jgi:hypothetical protein
VAYEDECSWLDVGNMWLVGGYVQYYVSTHLRAWTALGLISFTPPAVTMAGVHESVWVLEKLHFRGFTASYLGIFGNWSSLRTVDLNLTGFGDGWWLKLVTDSKGRGP